MRSTDDETERSGGSRGSVPAARTALIAGMVVLSTILAGCSGVPFLGGGGPSVDASQEVKQELSVSPITIYQRVEEMVGMQDPEYPSITVVYQGVNQRLTKNATALFLKTVVGHPPTSDATEAEVQHTYDPTDDTILINISVIRRTSQAKLQSIIAGEFFRAYMFQQNWSRYNQDLAWLDGKIAKLGEKDGFLPQALTRGAVNYVQKAYARKHLDKDITVAPRWSSDTGTYEKWFAIDRSRIGMQYFQRTLDSPTGLVDFFSGDIPVKSVEQMLHKGAEPPGNLTMQVATNDWWRTEGPSVQGPASSLLVDPRNPRGELGIRYVLQSQLPNSRANAAAQGWKEDAVRSFTSFYANESAGVVWAIRWDSAAEADEFVNAMNTYVQQRTSDANHLRFTIDRPNDTTTVVLAGNETFYREVSYEIQGDTVKITAGN